MTNLHQDNKSNLVSFLRHNQPLPPDASPNLEQQIIDSLESHPRRKIGFKVAWTVPRAIATGFLFTSVSFGIKTPRIAVEPKDLENFLVKNWHNTLDSHSYTATEEMEADWLLPNMSEQPALAVSVQ